MKITHHVPTEQYGFTEYEVLDGEAMSYEEAKRMAVGANSLKETGFNAVLDKYVVSIKTGPVTSDEYERMNPLQKDLFQVIKRLSARKNNDN